MRGFRQDACHEGFVDRQEQIGAQTRRFLVEGSSRGLDPRPESVAAAAFARLGKPVFDGCRLTNDHGGPEQGHGVEAPFAFSFRFPVFLEDRFAESRGQVLEEQVEHRQEIDASVLGDRAFLAFRYCAGGDGVLASHRPRTSWNRPPRHQRQAAGEVLGGAGRPEYTKS